MKYPLNPNCKPLAIAKGKNLFIYFAYTAGNKRKLIRYRKGLNDSQITAKDKATRAKELFDEIQLLLLTKIFNGSGFIEQLAREQIPTFAEATNTYLNNRRNFVDLKTLENHRNGNAVRSCTIRF